jgi:uncharacterized protein YjeT (DUF2065 family)
MLLEMLLALSITLVVEGLTAWLLGYRQRRELLATVYINLMTNLPLNYLLWLCYYSGVRVSLSGILLLESLVVLSEWWLLVFALQEDSRKMLRLSFLMNLCSYGAGVLIFGL